MFDLKPKAAVEYRGEFNPIPTNVVGVRPRGARPGASPGHYPRGEPAPLGVDLEFLGTADAGFAHPPGDDRSVRRLAAPAGQDALGGDHSVQVVRVGFPPDQDHVLAGAGPFHRRVRVEHCLAHRGARRGVHAPGDPLLGRAVVEPREHQLGELGAVHPGEVAADSDVVAAGRERQRADLSDITLLVRAAGDPRPLLPVLTRTIHSLDPSLPVFQAMALEDALRQRLDKERGASSVLGVFGGLALLLSALGLYGVMAYAVARRTREVGVRMALGAARPQVLRQFVGEGVRLASVGLVIGLVIAAGLTRVIERFLYGITPTDIITFALCAALLGAVATLASLIPARRAARVDPMVALRTE